MKNTPEPKESTSKDTSEPADSDAYWGDRSATVWKWCPMVGHGWHSHVAADKERMCPKCASLKRQLLQRRARAAGSSRDTGSNIETTAAEKEIAKEDQTSKT